MPSNAKLLVAVSATLLMLSVSACGKNGRDPIGDGCLTFQPILLLDYEWNTLSENSENQILSHNETWDTVCGSTSYTPSSLPFAAQSPTG